MGKIIHRGDDIYEEVDDEERVQIDDEGDEFVDDQKEDFEVKILLSFLALAVLVLLIVLLALSPIIK